MSQLAWSVGQPSGAVLLLLGVDARAVTAGQLLDHMLQLAEAAGVAVASGVNLSACEELIEYVKTQVPHIKLAMQSYASDLTTAQAKIAALEIKVEALTKEAAAQRAMMAASKRRVLLGEGAFMLDKVASEFVMQQAKFTYTVFELKCMAKDNELEPEQLKRWEQFNKFLLRQGWAVSKLCAQSRLLKELRHGDAHSTPEEKAAVSKADLVKWVGEEPLVTAPEECQDFLELVSKFGKEGTPLLPLAEVAAVLDAQ